MKNKKYYLIYLLSLMFLNKTLNPGDFGKKKVDSQTLSHETIHVSQNFKAKISYFDSKQNKTTREINNLNFDSNNLFLAGIDDAGSMINSSLMDIREIEVITPLSRVNPSNPDTMLTKLKLIINNKKGRSNLIFEVEGKILVRGNLAGTEATIVSKKISDIYKLEEITFIPTAKSNKASMVESFFKEERNLSESDHEKSESHADGKIKKINKKENLSYEKKEQKNEKPRGLLQNLKTKISEKFGNLFSGKRNK